MSLKDFLTGGYSMFESVENRLSYEVAVVDGRTGVHKLGKLDAEGNFIWMGLPYVEFDDKEVYSWTHSDRVLLIIV